MTPEQRERLEREIDFRTLPHQHQETKEIGAAIHAALARIEELEERCGEAEDAAVGFQAEAARLHEALSLIAAPMRPDGTYNRDRRACEELAREVLRGEQ